MNLAAALLACMARFVDSVGRSSISTFCFVLKVKSMRMAMKPKNTMTPKTAKMIMTTYALDLLGGVSIRGRSGSGVSSVGAGSVVSGTMTPGDSDSVASSSSSTVNSGVDSMSSGGSRSVGSDDDGSGVGSGGSISGSMGVVGSGSGGAESGWGGKGLDFGVKFLRCKESAFMVKV